MPQRLHKIGYLFYLLIIFCTVLEVEAQSSKSQFKEQKQPGDTPKAIFAKIEESISIREIERFSNLIGNQTYLSISNIAPGYYSSNQVFYILQDYFRIHKPITFKFISLNDKSENPYASGIYRFESKGIRGTAQVYISLKLYGNLWKVSQITIN